jgi:hypothetical protein
MLDADSALSIALPTSAPLHVCTVHLGSDNQDAIAAFFLASKSSASFLCVAIFSNAISDLAFCFSSMSCVHPTQNSSSLLRFHASLCSSSISAAVCIASNCPLVLGVLSIVLTSN